MDVKIESMGDRVVGTELVGRGAHLAALHAAATDLREVARVVLVAGEAGIGKSVLIETFGRQLKDHDVRVWVGGCVELAGDPIPYAPVMQIIRTIERAGSAADDVLGGGPRGLHPGWGIPAGDRVARDRGVLYERWLDILDAVVASADGVLVVEDLHWADAATLDFLLFLSSNLRIGLLLVLTYRDDELGARPGLQDFLGAIGRGRHTRRVDLNRLTRADIGGLAESLHVDTTSESTLDEVFARSGGNPFLAVELLSSPGVLGMHATVEHVLLSRTRNLTPSGLDLLQLIAIFERPVSHDLLASCGDWDSGPLLSGLRENIASGLLTVDEHTEEYSFRHVLTREAVLHRLLPGEKRRLHGVAAAAIGSQPETRTSANRAAECATHWYLSGDRRAALPAAVSAGRLAAEVFAWSEAAMQFTRAVALDDHDREGESTTISRRELLVQAAVATSGAGAAQDAVTLARSALDLTDDRLEQARVLAMIAEQLMYIGRLDEGRVDVERAELLLADLPATPLTATVETLKAGIALSSGHYDAAITAARHAVETAAATRVPAAEGRARLCLGVALIETGSVEQGTDLARQGHQLITKWADPDARWRANTTLSYALLMAGNAADACDVAVAGVAELRRYGVDPATAAVSANAILALRLTGRWSEAEQLLDQALAIDPLPAASAALLYLDRVELDTAVGRLDRAHQYLERAWRAALGDETSTVTVQLHLMASVLAIEEQDLGTARRHIDLLEGQTVGVGIPARAVAQLCCIALRIDAEIDQRASWLHDLPPVLGDGERRELLNRVHRVQSTASNPEIDALAVTATAEYNRREPVADPELWERATEAWEKASQPYEVAYCYYRWAEAELDARKTPRTATDPLRKSHEIASSLGAATLKQQVEDLARRSRITLAPPTSEKQTAPASGAKRLGITPREQDVLRALMSGQSNREIAERLYLSPRTVEVHVSNLLSKLGVTSRAQATRAAAHLGLYPEA